MFELIIKRQDQSIYWTERFNSLSEAQKWLATEQTRPYWVQSYTSEIIDHTPPPPSQAEIDAAAAAEAAEGNRRTAFLAILVRLRELDAQPDLTAVEIKESVRKLTKAFLRLVQKIRQD